MIINKEAYWTQERTGEHREDLCKELENIKKNKTGNSLVIQGLGLSTFTAGARVQSLVRELRSCQPCGTAREKKKEDEDKNDDDRDKRHNNWNKKDTRRNPQ